LHSTKQRGDCLTCHLFGGGLVNSELRGKLIHRNVSQDVIYSTHHRAFLPAAEKQRPGQVRRIGSNTVAIGRQQTIAAVQTFARHEDPAGWGCAVIASTPTSLTEQALLGLIAVT
jgi:hypothetical protein